MSQSERLCHRHHYRRVDTARGATNPTEPLAQGRPYSRSEQYYREAGALSVDGRGGCMRGYRRIHAAGYRSHARDCRCGMQLCDSDGSQFSADGALRLRRDCDPAKVHCLSGGCPPRPCRKRLLDVGGSYLFRIAAGRREDRRSRRDISIQLLAQRALRVPRAIDSNYFAPSLLKSATFCAVRFDVTAPNRAVT